MKYLILLLTLAALTPAQAPPTSPVIVRRVVLQNQTTALGSQQSPVNIFTPNTDGFYRITVFINGPANAVVCPVYAPHIQAVCALSGDSTGYAADASVVVAFTVKAGQPIGYFVKPITGSVTGTYSLYMALELLY